jgi:hypothetical protein
MKIVLTALAVCLAPLCADAQIDQVVTPPPNLVLANYNSVPVGPFGGLEGTAYVARVGDPSAAWFNPAGLALQNAPQISGSAGVYQRTSLSPQSLPHDGGSFQQLPNFVGFTFAPRPQVTVGAALITTNAWSQETDAEAISSVSGGQQRFAYSADSDFQRRILAIGAGYQGNGRWRAGGGFAFSMSDVRLVQSASDRIGTATDLRSLLVTSRTSGSTIQIRSQGGVQYDTSQWRLGAAIRTPGLTIHRSGGLTLDGLLDAGNSSLGASIFDPDAKFDTRLPWEVQSGVAWVRDRVELELDVQGYLPIDAYSMFESDQPVLVYTHGIGQAPSAVSQPFPGLTSASNGVVNVSAGGHVRLFKNRDARMHAGIGSNTSPVAADDMVFNNADLMTWTLGLSGSLGKFQFSAGFNHQFGHANDVTLRNLLSGQVVRSTIDVSMSGFIYALAYQF